jgi:hypothetical protein
MLSRAAPTELTADSAEAVRMVERVNDLVFRYAILPLFLYVAPIPFALCVGVCCLAKLESRYCWTPATVLVCLAVATPFALWASWLPLLKIVGLCGAWLALDLWADVRARAPARTPNRWLARC